MASAERTTKTSTRLRRSDQTETSAPSSVFATKDVLCHIFSFLDFFSIIKCQLVSKQWNDDAKDPSIVDYLNLSDCYHKNSGHIINSIKRFRRTKHLVFDLDFFLTELKMPSSDVDKEKLKARTTFFNLCSELILFNKIESLALTFNKDTLDEVDVSCVEPLICIIKQNNDKMVNLRILEMSSGLDLITDDDEIAKESDNIANLIIGCKYQNLEKLMLKKINISNIDKFQTTWPIFSNLKHLGLFLIDIDIPLSSWRNLVKQDQFKYILLNLQSLSLVYVHLRFNEGEQAVFINQIAPVLGKSLINLEKIEMIGPKTGNFIDDYRYLLSLLYHISINQCGNNNNDIDNGHSKLLKEVSLAVFEDHFDEKLKYQLNAMTKLSLNALANLTGYSDGANVDNVILLFGKNVQHFVLTTICYDHEYFAVLFHNIDTLSLKKLLIVEVTLDCSLHPYGVHEFLEAIDAINKGKPIEPFLRITIDMTEAEDLVDDDCKKDFDDIMTFMEKWYRTRLMEMQIIHVRDEEMDRKMIENLKLSATVHMQISKLCQMFGNSAKVEPLCEFVEYSSTWSVRVQNASCDCI